MSQPLPLPQFFDREADCLVTERRLPHWAQAGTICFITWRTWDSLPRQVLDRWLADRAVWLRRHGINPQARDINARIRSLSKSAQDQFHQLVSERWEASLDECHGSCVLRNPELSEIVAESLGHFNGKRYLLTDYIVMPNHVHLLASFADEQQMLEQCDSWKHFTATQLNRALGRKGRFWQADGFDHLVRSEESFKWLRKYIADNPNRAGLRAGEFRHCSQLAPSS